MWLRPMQSSGGCGWRVRSWRRWVLGGIGGVAHLVLGQLMSGLKAAHVFEDIFSLSSLFKAAELCWDYFPNLLFTALRTHDLFLKES